MWWFNAIENRKFKNFHFLCIRMWGEWLMSCTKDDINAKCFTFITPVNMKHVFWLIKPIIAVQMLLLFSQYDQIEEDRDRMITFEIDAFEFRLRFGFVCWCSCFVFFPLPCKWYNKFELLYKLTLHSSFSFIIDVLVENSSLLYISLHLFHSKSTAAVYLTVKVRTNIKTQTQKSITCLSIVGNNNNKLKTNGK